MNITIDDSAIPALASDAPPGTRDVTAYAKAKVLFLVAQAVETYRADVAERLERDKTAQDPNFTAATTLLTSARVAEAVKE